MIRRLLILILLFAACADPESGSGSTDGATSYGFGRNGTPDDIWAAQDASAGTRNDTINPADTTTDVPIMPSDSDTAEPTDAPDPISADVIPPDTAPSDTVAPLCGNGVVDAGEQCDFSIPGSCPTECIDPPGCTATVLEGSAQECSAVCVTIFVTEAIDNDACCPPGETAETDSDCNLCGNGQLDVDETCDDSTGISCPTATDCPPNSGCNVWTLEGSADSCTAECTVSTTTVVADGDACCPAGASEATDSDCIQVCGDGIIAGAEQCEPDVLISQTCSQFGYAGGEPTCLSNCQLSTLTCTGGHTLSFEKISNFILVGDIAHIVWHGSGEWALLVAQNGTLAQYDAASGAVVALPALEGTPRDVGRSSDGESILIAGTSGDAAVVWRVEEDEQAGVIISLWELPLIGTEATCVVPSPTDAEWTVCTRVNNTGGYINRLYRISDIDGVLGSTAYASGSGISDAMWTTTAYPGSNAIVSTEGLNGAGSQSWVLASDITVGNGWSPGFGNAGRAEWRPNGEYGIAVGTSTNSVYVFDGAWQSTKTPSANNGATGNAIAWTADGARALVVARPTGAPLEGSVFDFRPGGTNQYDSAHWYNASIPSFGDAPYNGSFNTHLLDVSWRPGTACDEGLIVGADNGSSFDPTFGLVVRFFDEDDPDCL